MYSPAHPSQFFTHFQYGLLLNLFASTVPFQGLSSSQYPIFVGVAQAFAMKPYMIKMYKPYFHIKSSTIHGFGYLFICWFWCVTFCNPCKVFYPIRILNSLWDSSIFFYKYHSTTRIYFIFFHFITLMKLLFQLH